MLHTHANFSSQRYLRNRQHMEHDSCQLSLSLLLITGVLRSEDGDDSENVA